MTRPVAKVKNAVNKDVEVTSPSEILMHSLFSDIAPAVPSVSVQGTTELLFRAGNDRMVIAAA